ncbi:MAG: hypothetical protein ACI3XJ_05520 [Oscillospiraceae bacterium]
MKGMNMKAYIVGGGADGTEEYEGVYHLVTSDGNCWASQWCTSFEDAKKSLYDDRPQMRADLERKHGDVVVLRLGSDAMTFSRLLEREGSYVPAPKGLLADGLYYNLITVKDGEWTKSEPRPIQELGTFLVEALVKKSKE